MTVDFRSLLGKQASTVEKPKPLAAGTYLGVTANREFQESKEKKTPFVRYTLRVTGPGEGMDPALLEGVDLSKKQLRKDFYLTPDAEYRLVEFSESCGNNREGRSIGEMIEMALNKPVLIAVTQRQSPDGQDIYNDVASITGVPA